MASGIALDAAEGLPKENPKGGFRLTEGKSEYPRDHLWVNFTRQPLMNFHYFLEFSRDAMNWKSSLSCDEFVSTCVGWRMHQCIGAPALHGGAAQQEAAGRFGECESEQIL